MASLTSVLKHGAFLLESTKDTPNSVQPNDLAGVLRARLHRYYASIERNDSTLPPDASLEELQMETALQALNTVENAHSALSSDSDPMVGTRDMLQIKTLLSLVFRWGTEPLLRSVSNAWPNKSSSQQLQQQSSVIDLTDSPSQYQTLTLLTKRVIHIIFPRGVAEPLSETYIASMLVRTYISDVLKPCIVLGWLPQALSTPSISTVDELRPPVMRLLALLPPAETLHGLGSVLSATAGLPIHARKAVAVLMSRQLQRPQGVRGLFFVIFGEGTDPNDAPLEKLEHCARLLATPPSASVTDDYFRTVIPRILDLCESSTPPAYRRAASFTLSRMLDEKKKDSVASKILLDHLHSPLLQISPTYPSQPQVTIDQLSTLVGNGDPSPTLITSLLTPIVHPLYSLHQHLRSIKTSDPAIKQMVLGLLAAWGKLVDFNIGVNTLWEVVDGGLPKLGWSSSLDELKVVERKEEETPALVMPSDRTEELELHANILNLYPDPSSLVEVLNAIGRKDIASEIFLQLLEAYQRGKRENGDPTKTLLYLQLIMEIQQNIGSRDHSIIMARPEKMLIFIKHAFEAALVTEDKDETAKTSNPLRIISEDQSSDSVSDGGDSDDDLPDSERSSPEDEMTETALNLLLVVLEANKSFAPDILPLADQIFDLIEQLASRGSSTTQPLAREARMMLTVRIFASSNSSDSSTSATKPEDEAQRIYQEALGLLQEPLLPVRAHGIFLLRQLVSPQSSPTMPMADPALVPAILSIFLQSVRDNESYMFLNATQGLAAMVDGYGKEVLKGLVKEYTKSLDGLGVTSMSQQEMDARTRIGEALGIVIRRCGDALGASIDLIMPSLIQSLRWQHVPIALKTSALSLIAECARTSSVALSSYLVDLILTMIDLLQVEASQTSVDEKEGTLDSKPTTTHSKQPPLRRAAVHVLTVVVMECRMHPSSVGVDSVILGRAKTILGYTAATDADSVVRVMAGEALENIKELERDILGL